MKKTRTKCNEQEWIRRVEPHPDAPTLRVKKREEQSRDRSRRCNCPLGTSGQVWDRNKEYLEFAYAGNNLRNWQRTNRKKRRRKEERRNVKGIIIRNRFCRSTCFYFPWLDGSLPPTRRLPVKIARRKAWTNQEFHARSLPLFCSLESCFVPSYVDRSNGDTSRINRV